MAERELNRVIGASPLADGRDTDDGDSSNSTMTQVDPLHAVTPAATTEILLRHVHVNAIADYYYIPQLKHLANTKIQRVLKTTWSANGFSDVVKETFSSTGDPELHQIISLSAAAHIEELVELEGFAGLDIIGDFTIAIMRNMVASRKASEDLLSQKLQAIESQLQDAESRLHYQKTLLDYETTRADRMIENIDNCIDTLSETNTCRNVRCEAEFNCYIERGGRANEPVYTLRCARCRCRHKGM